MSCRLKSWDRPHECNGDVEDKIIWNRYKNRHEKWSRFVNTRKLCDADPKTYHEPEQGNETIDFIFDLSSKGRTELLVGDLIWSLERDDLITRTLTHPLYMIIYWVGNSMSNFWRQHRCSRWKDLSTNDGRIPLRRNSRDWRLHFAR